MKEKSKLFRQQSIDRLSSPDDLNKYIKTTSPALAILILAVLIFLVGTLVWAIFGRIETKSEIGFSVIDNKAIAYIKEEEVSRITTSSFMSIDDTKFSIAKISANPILADENSDQYLLHTSSISLGEWYYQIEAICSVENGYHKGKIVYEIISPISFIY